MVALPTPIRRCAGWLIMLLTWTLIPSAHGDVPPLPEAWRTALSKVESDPPPKQLAKNAHFVRSDEAAHWVAHDTLQGAGGLLLGVGTDPNYLIAAWMKADLVLVVDFDQVVVDIHTLYRLALQQADTPEAFVQVWSPKGNLQTLVQSLPDAAMRQRTLHALKLSRGHIYQRLLALQAAYKRHKTPMCFSDPDGYAHVRALSRQGRIWAWRGDLTAKTTMMGLQQALRAMGRTISVFYLTNAETYFPYTAQVRINLGGLPFADNAWVLRTHGKPSLPAETADGFYRYLLQRGRDFAAWMERTDLPNVHRLAAYRQRTKTKGLFMLPGPPPRKG